MSLFPYEARDVQKKMMEKIKEALEKRKNIVLHAPAGSGKTAGVLAPVVSFALDNDMGVIYLTRTNSQQKQAIKELKLMEKKTKIKAVGIQGKANMCLLIENIPSLLGGGNEEISRFCSARKKRSIEYLRGKKNPNRCIFFENFLLLKDKLNLNGVKAAEEMMEYGRKNKICAYEMNKLFMKNANVVVAPYIYIFDDALKEKFASWYSYPFKRTVVIIDEAHNLPDFAREIKSASLSIVTIKNAIKEKEEYNIADEDIDYFIKSMQDFVEGLAEELKYSKNGDAIIGNELEKEFSSIGISKEDMKKIAEKLISYGDVIADMKESQNLLPRSYLRSMGKFTLSWISFDERWVKIAEEGKIEAYCMDPSIATSILNEFYSSIHMSGTLEPMEEYVKSIGINADMLKLSSSFPEENRKIFYIDGLTTKYYMDNNMVKKIGKEIEKICNSNDKNILVFFPSYSILERFVNIIKINRRIYIEKRKDKQALLMKKIEKFKKNGGIFLSVMGGRISEGMDFPSEEVEIVLIVGIPYPPPSAKLIALQSYYDKKFGNGWKYVVEAKAIRKIEQAIGRLIRSEKDKGIAIILDERAKRFKKYIDMERCNNAVHEIKKFWENPFLKKGVSSPKN